ncbi:hypothetical protein [Kosakonia sacchari]|uniref:hypothetical protein n=1 Tax=Kosakonia sacchari TaxID=1158459 RepID=UPI0015855ECD|nr:hypothetical protein [Kosakonia sacchari]NUL37863.1 hypothetical protein [Kosakonia sacchari]
MSKNQEFINYLSEASRTVAEWPQWKKNGSDATVSQNKVKEDNSKTAGKAVFVTSRIR